MGLRADRALSELLTERELVSPTRLREALTRATRTRTPLEEILVGRGDLVAEVLHEVLAARRRRARSCVACGASTFVLRGEHPAKVRCDACAGAAGPPTSQERRPARSSSSASSRPGRSAAGSRPERSAASGQPGRRPPADPQRAAVGARAPRARPDASARRPRPPAAEPGDTAPPPAADVAAQVEAHIERLDLVRKTSQVARAHARQAARQALDEAGALPGEGDLRREVQAAVDEALAAQVPALVRRHAAQAGLAPEARRRAAEGVLDEVRQRLAQQDVTPLAEGLIERAVEALVQRLEADDLLALGARVDRRAAATAHDELSALQPVLRQDALGAARREADALREQLGQDLTQQAKELVERSLAQVPSEDELREAVERTVAAATDALRRETDERLERMAATLRRDARELRATLDAQEVRLRQALRRRQSPAPTGRGRRWDRAVQRRAPQAMLAFAAAACLVTGGVVSLPPRHTAEALVAPSEGTAPYPAAAEGLIARALSPVETAGLVEAVGDARPPTWEERTRDLLLGSRSDAVGRLAPAVVPVPGEDGVHLFRVRAHGSTKDQAARAATLLAERLVALDLVHRGEGAPRPLAILRGAQPSDPVTALPRVPHVLAMALAAILVALLYLEVRGNTFHEPGDAADELGLPLLAVVGTRRR